jgi:DNA polymerase III subunit beta
MKTKILQEKLYQAVSGVEKITGKDVTLPILSNILLKAEKNSLTTVATNLETGISWKLLSKTEEEGAVALPAQTLSGLVGSFPASSISIEADANSVTISGERRKSTIKGLSADEFPALPISTNGECLTIKSEVFCQSLAQVVGFTSISSVKPEITGVYVVFLKDEIKIVATDSFRLGEKTLKIPKGKTLSKEYSIILPARAVKEIISIFGDKRANLNIFFSVNQITIEIDPGDDAAQPRIQFVSRLIDGEFPDYRAIIPTAYAASMEFSKKELLNHLKSAGLFAGKGNEIVVKLSQKEQTLAITSRSAELGDYESDLKLDRATGDDITITFNYRFLADGLGSIKDDKCVFDFSSDDGPGVLRPAEGPDFIYILMPIKKY